MKPISFHVSRPEKESVKVEKDRLPHFYDKLHFHPDNQITAICTSRGTLYSGDSMTLFEDGDVYLIGQNLSHVFRNDTLFYSEPSHIAESISVYFKNNFMGSGFLDKKEATHISDLLISARKGIRLRGSLKKTIFIKLTKIAELEGMERIIDLLNILHQISVSTELETLASVRYSMPVKDEDNKRINSVFNYLINHFTEQVTLEMISEIANMSPTAFCRYFKNHTRKTFIQYLNEIRIGHACKLLMSDNFSVAQICYECGFSNLSNFNRQFKVITGYSPRKYIQQRYLNQG
ncbi:MAG: helix-turn-helix domain-containing protein [Bacteroidetes bacterium]|nr:helix-turn-helix domain-containing protein [Bacteroidota bacterium]MCH8233347.1 helix-turn-helix domain-containing protein [Bacteroidota bacterium]